MKANRTKFNYQTKTNNKQFSSYILPSSDLPLEDSFGSLNDKCPKWSQLFEHVFPDWWQCEVVVYFSGGFALLKKVFLLVKTVRVHSFVPHSVCLLRFTFSVEDWSLRFLLWLHASKFYPPVGTVSREWKCSLIATMEILNYIVFLKMIYNK